VFTQKRAWLIVLGVASIGFLAIWIAKLYIPLLQPIDPYSDFDTTLWLHALIFLPFLFVFGLFLFTTAINKFPKIATFLGVWAIYAPLTMAIVNAMAGIIFFPIFFLLWPLIESLIEFSDWLGLKGLAAEYFWLSRRRISSSTSPHRPRFCHYRGRLSPDSGSSKKEAPCD